MCLSNQVRVLDLDGSVAERQQALLSCLAYPPVIANAQDIGRQVRYLSTRSRMQELETYLAPDNKNCLTFLGSGDFHHVSASLLGKFNEPLSLVVFDTHPDWDRTSPWPCCGSWVLDALRMPNVRHVAMIGLGAVDITGWHINVGAVREIRAGRVAFYPATHPTSRTFWQFRAESVPCAQFVPQIGCTQIRWNTLAGQDWEAFMDALIDSLPTDAVYVSVDKDSLRPEEATTNWEPGALPLADVIYLIRRLRQDKDIIGADIVGEYSPIKIDNPLFRASTLR